MTSGTSVIRHLLVPLALTLFVYSSSNSVSAFDPHCPTLDNCTCEPTDDRIIELFCTGVRYQYEPRRFIKIECESAKLDFAKLPTFEVKDVDHVSFKGCTLPPHSVKNIMGQFGVNTFKWLSYANDDKDFSLRKDHFKGLEINRLTLNTAGLQELPDDFFEEIANLTWLEMKNTKLQRVKKALSVLTKIKTFEMPWTAITQLEEGAFESAPSLERLSLYSNQLQEIGKEDFRGLENVLTLDLLANKITKIDKDAFLPLTNLVNLGLNKNLFRELPEGLFRGNSRLGEVKLQYNTIPVLPSDLFANLPNMKTVYMSSSAVESVPETIFANSTSIEVIEMNGNKISQLKPRTFEGLKNLTRLELNSNLLVDLPKELLAWCRQLKTLDLSNNLIETIPNDLLQTQVNLETLLLRNNRLTTFSPRVFDYTVTLAHLDMSHNQLSFSKDHLPIFGDLQSPLQKLKSVQVLKLANNSIEAIYSDFYLLMVHLQELDLSHNQITTVSYNQLRFRPNNRVTVDLSHNRIEVVDFRDFASLAKTDLEDRSMNEFSGSWNGNAPQVRLLGNPLSCNCTSLTFARFLRNNVTQDGTRIKVDPFLNVDSDDILCSNETQFPGIKLKDVPTMQLTCDFTEDCTEGCRCTARPDDLALIVNCSSSNFHFQPITNASYGYNFTILDISNNALTHLPTVNMSGYSDVRDLIAANNNISQVLPENIPQRMQSMDLRRNLISKLSKDITSVSGLNHTFFYLSENPWSCACDMKEEYLFIKRDNRVSDYYQIQCQDGQFLSELSDVCFVDDKPIVLVAIILCCLGITFGVVAALYFKYQQEIKIWMYWHNIMPFLFNSDVLDSEKKYDAFISYSHKDEDFVTDQLMPELEQKRRFNLCIHRRDWTPGDFIPEQIVRSVTDSRRTLIVLSPNYVESIWGTMEFRTAHRSAMEDQVNRVIVILFGKVDKEALDPELKSYIDMNTYIEWGDPWFWERLHYALRTIHTKKKAREQEKSTGLLKTPMKSSVDDRLELIHPSPLNSPLNSPLTTPPAESPMNYKQNGHVNGAFIINTNSKQSDV